MKSLPMCRCILNNRSKPDPEVYQLAAKRLGILPEQCKVEEDSAAGIEAAFACGMRTAAVGYAAERVLL